MRTDLIGLRLGKSDGTVKEQAMRYNASHQRGYRCFIGPIANAPQQITEATTRSFEGHSLFDALAVYRATIEPEGWRLLHAVARRDCWPKPEGFSRWVHQLTPATEDTQRVDGFEAAAYEHVTTLAEQRANFARWMDTLASIHLGRVPRKAGREHSPAGVDFSAVARCAGEYLVNGKLDLERALGRMRP